MKTLTLNAPAKVNLFLEVTGKRPDGYHELATLFAKVSLCDVLHIQAQTAEREELHLRITGPLGEGLAADNNNLVLRAVRAFENRFGLTLRADILLDKRIPMGAGLGGGSSDSGTVLRALCALFGKDTKELLPDAARLGADVPLFLYPDAFLKGEGIGEKLTPVSFSGPLPWAVLVYPDTPVPTKGVFGRLQLPDKDTVLTSLANLDKLLEYVRQGVNPTLWQTLFFNRLESAVLPYVCSVRNAKEDFSALGAQPLMSGSGSTVFALVSDRGQAEDLAGRMKQKGRKVFIVRFGGRTDENNGNSDSFDGGRAAKSIRQRDV